MFNLVGLITLIPFIGFLVNGIFGKKIKNEKIIGAIGCLAVAIPAIISIGIFIQILGTDNLLLLFNLFLHGSNLAVLMYQLLIK